MLKFHLGDSETRQGHIFRLCVSPCWRPCIANRFVQAYPHEISFSKITDLGCSCCSYFLLWVDCYEIYYMHKLIRYLGIKILKNIKSFLEYLSAFKLSINKVEPISIFQRREHWGENECHSHILPLNFRWAVKGKWLRGGKKTGVLTLMPKER